jgi:hypothetical protein
VGGHGANSNKENGCPNDYKMVHKHCRFGEIAVPLPFACTEKHTSIPLFETTCQKGNFIFV